MTIAYSTDWEIRTTGSYSNGGGFNRLAAGTDYSQQDVAELSLTDCATSGVGSTTLTSVTGGFTAAMVGNVINLSSGTNLTANWYEITGYTDANTVTIDRAPDDGVGGVTGATGKVGGALSWPPPRSADGGPITTYNKFWIKSGTYTLTNTTPGSENGPVFLDQCSVEGYEHVRGDTGRKPVFSAGSQTPSSATGIFRVYTQFAAIHLSNIKADGVDSSRNWTGIEVADYRNAVQHCEAVNCKTGFAGSNNIIRFCKASYCETGIGSFTAEFCVAHDCTSTGISVYINEAFHCLVYNCPVGFNLNGGADVFRCIAHNCSTYGIYHYAGYGNSVRCLATNCGIGIYYHSTALSSDKNLLYNNTQSVAYNSNNPASRYVSYDDTSITTDPYVDSANGNFSLNEDETGGQVVRNAWSVSDSSDIYSIFYPKVFPRDTSITEVADGDYYYPFRHLVADSFHEDTTEGTSEDFQRDHARKVRPFYRFEIGSNRQFQNLNEFHDAYSNTLIDQPHAEVLVVIYNDTGQNEFVASTGLSWTNQASNVTDITITVDDDSWHKGREGYGVVIRPDSAVSSVLVLNFAANFVFERVVIDANNQLSNNSTILNIGNTHTQTVPHRCFLKDIIVRGGDGTYNSSARAISGIYSEARPVYLENCIVYNLLSSGAATGIQTIGISRDDDMYCKNCLVYNLDFTSSTNSVPCLGFSGMSDVAYGGLHDCIALDVNGDCVASGVNVQSCVTDDGTGTLSSTSAAEFVDAANGDFRLRSSSVAAGTGSQLTSAVFSTDITGRIKTRVPGVTTDSGPFNNIAGYDLDVVFPGEEEAVVATGTNTSGLQTYPFRQWVSTNFDSGTTRPTHPLRSS